MHKNKALVIRQIEVMRDRRMRLRVRAVHLERAEMREDHGGGVCVRRLVRRRSRFLRWRVKRPLQEVDICRRLRRCAVGILDLWLGLGGLLAREREDELRVLARGFCDALVCV